MARYKVGGKFVSKKESLKARGIKSGLSAEGKRRVASNKAKKTKKRSFAGEGTKSTATLVKEAIDRHNLINPNDQFSQDFNTRTITTPASQPTPTTSTPIPKFADFDTSGQSIAPPMSAGGVTDSVSTFEKLIDTTFGAGVSQKPGVQKILKFLGPEFAGIEDPDAPMTGTVPGMSLGKAAGAAKIAKNIAKFNRGTAAYFKPTQKFGLGVLGKNKIDLNFMRRLGDYVTPTGKLGAKIGFSPVQNTKTVSILANRLKKHLTKNAFKYFGAWVIGTSFSLWGKAEAPEPFSFNSKYIIQDALATGNWTIYEEAKAAEAEVMDYSWWQDILSWTGMGGLVTFPKKLKGIIEGSKARMAATDSIKHQQETGQSVADMWIQINADKAAAEKLSTDYFNAERIATEQEIITLRRNVAKESDARARKAIEENIKLWEEYAADASRREAADRKAQADFWLAYQKELLKIKNDNSPSKLNFGLL